MKKAKKRKNELDAFEQQIDDALDYKNLRLPSAAKRKKVHDAAKATLRDLKSVRANLRMNEDDLMALRAMAQQAGLPYQTLINHIIHLYVTGQLINSQEVKKMVSAGVFDQRKAGNS